MMKRFFAASLVLFALSFSVFAQEEQPPVPGTVIVDGLLSPRGIAYDADGNLWIAEAGAGGEYQVAEDGPFGPTFAGPTSQVSMLMADGSREVVMPMMHSLNAGGALGVNSVLPSGDSLWIVLQEGAAFNPFSFAVVQLDRSTLRVREFLDLYTFEQQNNSDGEDEVYSNPSDVTVADDGTVYIVDTGANALLRWTEAEGLTLVRAWENNPVPIAVDVAPDGSLWVGFLGQLITAGAAKVEHWSAEGELLETYEGLNGVTDVLVASDGTVYAVEMMVIEGGEGAGLPEPFTGRVLTLADGVATPYAEGLSFSYGIAEAPDGSIVVSTGALALSPGETGSIVKLNKPS
jgi:sugar lactone lactonase YvrE